MQNNPQKERPIPQDVGWDELEAWIAPLIQQERSYAGSHLDPNGATHDN